MRGYFSRAALGVTIVFAALATGTAAQASLIGDQVTAEVKFGSFTAQGPANAIVGAGLEFNFPNVDIDVGSQGAQFLNILAGSIVSDESYVLSDLDWLDPGSSIVGVDSSFSGLSIAPTVTLVGDILTVLLPGGTSVSAGATVTVRFLTEATTAVPEPSSLALIGAGLLAMGGLERRRARRG